MRYSQDATQGTSSEVFDGAGGSPTVAHSSGSWQEAVPPHVGLFTGLLECPPDLVADFPQVSDPSEGEAEV